MTMLDSPTVSFAPVAPTPKRRRGRKVALIVGLLIGLPAVALAAAYIWGSVTGSTDFIDGGTATVRVASVVGTTGAAGVDCSGSSKGADGKTVILAPKAPRVMINGTPQVTAGSCTVDVTLSNDGASALKISAVATMPTGWTFDAAPPVVVAAGGQGHLIATVTASATAIAAPITGSLSLDTTTT